MVQGKVCESRNHLGTWKRWWERETERWIFSPEKALHHFDVRITWEQGLDWWDLIEVSVQFSSVAQLYLTLCDSMDCSMQASLSITNSQSLLKLMSIELVMPSNYLILCCPLLLLPSIFPSIRVFSNESVLRIRWPKYWRFSFNISPSNEYSGLISFKMDWLDLLAVQQILKSILQHHSSKALILWRSFFFIVQYLP